MKLFAPALCALVALVTPLAAQDAPKVPADTEIVTLESGLKYSVLRAGDGKTKAKTGDVVKMHYTGWLTDGTVFDSSVTRGEPFYFELGRGKVIKGWDEAVAKMSKGEKLKLTIPAELGYGARATGKIPAGATLVFEVEMLDVPWSFAQLDASLKKSTPAGIGYQVLSGAAPAPKDGDFVRFTFAVWRPSGDLLTFGEDEAMRARKSPSKGLSMVVGDAPSPALNEALKLCPNGGSVRLEIPASVCWPNKLPPDLKPEQLVTWQVSVYEVSPLPAFSMPAADKLVKLPSGLAYEVLKEGTGKQPTANDRVTVHYIGWLDNGNRFDSSYTRGQPASFGLNGVIKGWTEGLQHMKEGGITKFVIPAELGYGAAGAGADIPPNSTLVFYIELISVP